MSNVTKINIGDNLYNARCQIHLICRLLDRPDDLLIEERDAYALSQQLWNIDDVLELAEKALDECKPPILSDLESTKKLIELGALRPAGALESARSAIEKIDDFLGNDVKQIMALADEFKEMEKYYKLRLKKQIEQKKAPAKAEDLAEAPSVDQKGSRTNFKNCTK